MQIFLSHTKEDKDFCDKFDVVCARVGIKAYRSEFETIKAPAWNTIKEEISKSSAVFLLVGEKLVELQKTSQDNIELRKSWSHTQNWIAFEVGLACQRGIDVWVLCDNVEINFPVPYFNNYGLGFGDKNSPIGFARAILEEYAQEKTFPLGRWDRVIVCPHKDCGIPFNFHHIRDPGTKIVCPQCLNRIVFDSGWLDKYGTKSYRASFP